jgi:hypothetical protein
VVQEYSKSLVTNSNGDLPLHYSCARQEPLEVVRYLVKEYPESLQVTDISGKKPIDLGKSPWTSNKSLHEVVAWLESAVADGVALEALSSSQSSV